METVTIWRPAPGVDEYLNAITGDLAQVGEVDALVAPGHVPEQDVTGRVDAIESVYDVYVRGVEVDVTDQDVLGIRGEMCPVDGVPRLWRRSPAAVAGTHIRCRRVAG